MKPVRVLHFFHSLDSGGVSSFVMNVYRQMDTDLVQFDFALTSGEKALYDDEVISRGGRIFYFDLSRGFFSNLMRILREEGPFEVLHSHLFFYSGLALLAGRMAGVPVRIAHAHNAHTGEKRSPGRMAYEKAMQVLIRTNATCLLGCSEKACLYVFGGGRKGAGRSVVLPDGIDCDRFAFDPAIRQEIRESLGLEDRFVVGHVGHFNPAKNHRKILSVFGEVYRRRPDAALLLVGDGELEEQVRQMVRDMGLQDRVVFAGARKDVERYYQAMDVFLFPSRYEGFGMAMIEAQAGGLACLASDVVPEETNVDGRVLYLPLEAEDALWAEKLLEARGREGGRADLVREKFSAGSAAAALRDIYLSRQEDL